MHFISKRACPKHLSDNQEKWSIKWINYYRWDKSSGKKRPPKPIDSHWLHDKIRIPLTQDFKNNCGYCGDAIPTPLDKLVGKGDVDHFLPKAEFPEKVYAWENYIWSCKPCNQHKLEFHDTEYPILDPCNEEDCSALRYIDNGRYLLVDAFSDDIYWVKRFYNTERKTLMNSKEACHKRNVKIGAINSAFTSISTLLSLVNMTTEGKKLLINQLEDHKKKMQELLNSDAPDFYFLTMQVFNRLCEKHPEACNFIKE